MLGAAREAVMKNVSTLLLKMHKEIKYSQITKFDKIHYMNDSNIYKNPTHKTSTTKNKQQGQLDFVYNHLCCWGSCLGSLQATKMHKIRYLEVKEQSKIATASSLQRSSDNIAANLLQAIFIQSNYASWYGCTSTILSFTLSQCKYTPA